MTRTQSAALVRNGRFSETTGLSARTGRRSGGALTCGVSLSVLAAVMAAGGGALVGAPMAYAQTVTLSGSQTTTQTVTGGTVDVETAPGFSVVTTTGPGILLSGTETTFKDANASTITGQTIGIDARNTQEGALSLTTNGTVTGRDNFGIHAGNLLGEGSPTDLTVSAAAVSGATTGIYALNQGTGTLSITSTGTVTGTSQRGIEANAAKLSSGISISATSVSGERGGIIARSDGTGAVSITSTGTVTSANGIGIEGRNYFGTDMTISAATIMSSGVGINAQNRGTGATMVTATGDVTSTSTDGINVNGDAKGTDVTVSAASVSGVGYGIAAFNNGKGALSITATGTVTAAPRRSGSSYGIYAQNYGTDLTVKSAAVSAGGYGIYARNYGSGALSITSTGAVTGTSKDGIYADNRSAATDLTIIATSVSGGDNGIRALNRGSGALSITSTGAVTGTNQRGIVAINGTRQVNNQQLNNLVARDAVNSGPTNLTISSAAVSGGTDGIYAINYGTGALSITSTGTVTGTSGRGIFASNGIVRPNSNYNESRAAAPMVAAPPSGTSTTYAGTNLTVTAAAVSGGAYGIYAHNYGSRALSITATGTVTGTSRMGVYAVNRGTALTVSTAAVSGGRFGIYARNIGSGALSITSTGAVTGTSRDGIYGVNRPGSTDLTIIAAAVSGGDNGIRALNRGSGALSITSTGPVTGTTGRGIVAQNGDYRRVMQPALVADSGTATNFTISTAAVSGGTDGIYAVNLGTGALSITSTGTVTGTSGRGIFAANGGFEQYYYGGNQRIAAAPVSGPSGNSTVFAGTSLTISTAAVSGGTDGIYARNFGTGALTITSTGTVTGTLGRGIFATNGGIATTPYSGGKLAVSGDLLAEMSNAPSYAGTDLTITTAAVSGGTDGIFATNYGTGALSVTSTGAVTGANGSGIYAYNAATATNLTVSAAAVSGSTNAIDARNYGTGALSVTASGAVTGGTGAGISTMSAPGAAVAINLTPTARVSATSGSAIVDGPGNAVVTINGGAVVTGSIALGEGNDTLTLNNGVATSGITSLDGGSGAFTDTLNLRTAFAGDMTSWEILNADTSAGGFTLNGNVSGTSIFNKLGAGNLIILGNNSLTGPTFVSGGRLSVNGSLANSLITVQNGGTLGGTGTVGTVIVQSGGTVAPGNSIGTLSVAGNFTSAAGSTLAIEISPTSTDLIAATGTASIAGNLAVIPEAGTYFGRTYTILTASSVTGTFASSTFGSPIGTAFRATVLYSPTSIMLRLDPNSLIQISGRTLRGNPLAVATAIDKAVDKGYNPQTFISLYTQGANLSGALGQLSGELHSAERRVALQDSRIVRETAFDRLNAGPVSGPGTSSVTSEAGDVSKTVWMRVAGSWGIARTDGIGARYGTDQTAVLVGADYGRDGFKFGGMFSYITTDLDLAAFGRSRVESIGGALYTGYRQDGSGFSVGLGGALASNTARGYRSISVPGLGQTLRSNVSGLSYQIFAEGAYDLAKAENIRLEPFVRIAYTGLESNAFTETGGNAALSGGQQKNQLTTATFGVRGGIVTNKITLSTSAAWQRTGGDRSAPTILSMAGVNTPYFVRSAALDRDALAVEAQASVSISSSFDFSLGYSGVLGRRNSDHGARATARVKF